MGVSFVLSEKLPGPRRKWCRLASSDKLTRKLSPYWVNSHAFRHNEGSQLPWDVGERGKGNMWLFYQRKRPHQALCDQRQLDVFDVPFLHE